MSIPTNLLLGTCAAAVICIVLAKTFSKLRSPSRSTLPLPPGPKGWPLIGNALDLTPHLDWLKFTAWGRTHGDVIYLSVFGSPLVVLNSARAVDDLLEKRSSVYSDRPELPHVGRSLNWQDSVPLCPHGERHRLSRKLLSTVLSPRNAEALWPIEEQKTRTLLLRNLLRSPERFLEHIRHTTSSIVLKISHGHDVIENDPFIELVERATREFGLATSPGAFLVDSFPILRFLPSWVPGGHYKVQVKAWLETISQLKDQPFNTVKKQIAEGSARPSFTATLIEDNPDPSQEEEDIFRWVSTGLYSAGADTTVSAISSFFLAMCKYPEVQRNAQAELDHVIGQKRLPNIRDRQNLPYIECMMKEILRWNPVAPLAIPHRLMRDDAYKGFRIPAGIVIANSWAIMHDESKYPDPYTFNPDRYMHTQSGDVNKDPKPYAFGYGRRVCPGIHMAEASLFITISSVLAVFNVSKAVDQRGQVIEPVVEYTKGTVSHPRPFQCRITPRAGVDVASLIMCEM